MVFGLLQQAKDKEAKKLVDEVSAIRKVDVENFIAAYAFAAIPSRYALERGDWKQAARLELSPADLAWNKFPQAEAILVFARGLGAARIGDVAGGRQGRGSPASTPGVDDGGKDRLLGGQADFQIKTVSAWIALAEKRQDEALKLMRDAADAEDASDKHPVTPGNVATSRELLGEMLMALNLRSRPSLEFERSLKRDPNRYREVYTALPTRRKPRATCRQPATITPGCRLWPQIAIPSVRNSSVQKPFSAGQSDPKPFIFSL